MKQSVYINAALWAAFHQQTPEGCSWGKSRSVWWQESDPYHRAKYTMKCLQDKIVEVLDNWAKGQTSVVLQGNLCSSLKMVFEILLVQPDRGWVKSWVELQEIPKSWYAKSTALFWRRAKATPVWCLYFRHIAVSLCRWSYCIKLFEYNAMYIKSNSVFLKVLYVTWLAKSCPKQWKSQH